MRQIEAEPSGGDVRVTDNPDALRYELHVGEAPAGLISYRLDGDTIALVHTEIVPARREKGLGERLVAAALADIRARGLRVVPLCSFVAAYIRRHPEEADLLAGRPGETGD